MNPADPDPFQSLALRERHRDEYWRTRDPIVEQRLLWRVQTIRHSVHLLPGRTILELGCGAGRLTQVLSRVTRGENPITAVTFQKHAAAATASGGPVERLCLRELPGSLEGRTFDCVVAMDLLDRRNASWLPRIVHALLAPGGDLVFYESNPWNPVHKLRRFLSRLRGRGDPRRLLSAPRLQAALSAAGFAPVYAAYNDFVFAPLTRGMIWHLRNLSILLENAPGLRRMAGSILLHAQKLPRRRGRPRVSLATHAWLRGRVSFVIPCRNEAMNVVPLLDGIREFYDDYVFEIIPVNDNSTDRTGAVLDELAAQDPRIRPIHRAPPNGVGRAIVDGLRAARGDYVLSMDCDFQHLLPEFRDLFDVAAMGDDVVVGSRFSRHSVLLGYPFGKILANRAFHALARLLLRRQLRDLTNNLKLMRRDVLAGLRLRQPGFAVNAETGLQPLLLGWRVAEVPISWINRTPGMGASSFRLLRVGGGYWRVLAGLWLRCVFGTGPYRDLDVRRRRDGLRPRPAGTPARAEDSGP